MHFAAAALAASAFFSTPAQAGTVDWTLNNFTFVDGAVATGGFSWDSVLNSISSFNISISAGTVFDAFTYSNESAIAYTNYVVTYDLVTFCAEAPPCRGPKPPLAGNFASVSRI